MSDKLKTTVLLIVTLALTRFIPHPPNATAILALSLFGGAAIANKKTAMLVVIAAMLLSDFLIGFHSTLPFVYVSLITLVFYGSGMLNIKSASSKALASVNGSLLFFVVTNFGVWMVQDLYPKTISGLVTCFVAGIPFLFNMILSTMAYLFVASFAANYLTAENKSTLVQE